MCLFVFLSFGYWRSEKNTFWINLGPAETRKQAANENKKLQLQIQAQETSNYTHIVTAVTLSIIAPIALTTAFFAMPQDAIPFPTTFNTFLISVLVSAAGLFCCVRIPAAIVWLREGRLTQQRQQMPEQEGGLLPKALENACCVCKDL